MHSLKQSCKEPEGHFEFHLLVLKENRNPRLWGTLPGSFVGMLDKDISWKIISR